MKIVVVIEGGKIDDVLVLAEDTDDPGYGCLRIRGAVADCDKLTATPIHVDTSYLGIKSLDRWYEWIDLPDAVLAQLAPILERDAEQNADDNDVDNDDADNEKEMAT